jgi:hypothetical protein
MRTTIISETTTETPAPARRRAPKGQAKTRRRLNCSRPPRTVPAEVEMDLTTVNQIEAIIGTDKLLRGYIIRGRFTHAAHDYLSAAHGKDSEWIWCHQAAVRWGATSVFARRSWLESQLNNYVPPTGILLRIFQ